MTPQGLEFSTTDETGDYAAKVTPLVGGVVDAREVAGFCKLAAGVGLSAAAIIQNAAALIQAEEIANVCGTLWIDAAETIRTVYGFPAEVLQAAAHIIPRPHNDIAGILRRPPVR